MAYRLLREYFSRDDLVAQTLEWSLALLGRRFEGLLGKIHGYGPGEVTTEQLTWFFGLHKTLKAWWIYKQPKGDGRSHPGGQDAPGGIQVSDEAASATPREENEEDQSEIDKEDQHQYGKREQHVDDLSCQENIAAESYLRDMGAMQRSLALAGEMKQRTT